MKALGYKNKVFAVIFTVLTSFAVFEMGDGYQAHPAHTSNKNWQHLKPISKLKIIKEIFTHIMHFFK